MKFMPGGVAEINSPAVSTHSIILLIAVVPSSLIGLQCKRLSPLGIFRFLSRRGLH